MEWIFQAERMEDWKSTLSKWKQGLLKGPISTITGVPRIDAVLWLFHGLLHISILQTTHFFSICFITTAAFDPPLPYLGSWHAPTTVHIYLHFLNSLVSSVITGNLSQKHAKGSFPWNQQCHSHNRRDICLQENLTEGKQLWGAASAPHCLR